MTRPGEILGSVVAASEREQLETFLDYLRDAVVRKARWVSEEDARRSPVPTGTNLGGLIKHLRWVELGGFAEQIGQIPAAELPTPPWTDADPEADLRAARTHTGAHRGGGHRVRLVARPARSP